jgi:hypothetical protein
MHVHSHALLSLLALALTTTACSRGGVSPGSVESAAQNDTVGSDDDCDPDSKDCPPPPAGACSQSTVGDGATCQQYADLKTQASEDCAALGGGLTDLQADAGSCPDGEASSAVSTCCLPATPSGPPPCTGSTVGDGTTCVDPATLHDEASAICAGTDTSLTYFYTSADGCDGDAVNIAKYLCCES